MSGLPPRCPAQDPPAGLPLEGSVAAQRGLSLGSRGSGLWALQGAEGLPLTVTDRVLEGLHQASLCVSRTCQNSWLSLAAPVTGSGPSGI